MSNSNLSLEGYYSIPSPSDSWLLSFKTLFGISVQDETYGRSTLPMFPIAVELRNSGNYHIRDEIVELKFNGIMERIHYSVLESNSIKIKADLIYSHGINDYGQKFLEHAIQFLQSGYRIISLDLPGHGRSTGIHCFLKDLEILPEALYSVLCDVIKFDITAGQLEPRKVFVAGQSLGGWVAVRVVEKYGSLESIKGKPWIAGGLFLCPMLAISKESAPPVIAVAIGQLLSYLIPTAPIIASTKGKNSEKPEVEELFLKDPMTYHGKIRASTGLAILTAFSKREKEISTILVPFSLFHGTGDRVTSFKGSQSLFDNAKGNLDREIKLYDEFEHVLLRKGNDETDDERRQRVILDMLDWLERHV